MNNVHGYRQNAQGHLVPEAQIKPIDKLRDEMVMEIVAAAKEQQQQLAAFKVASMQKIDAFVDLSAAEFDVKYGGAKGNVTLPSFDGRYRVQRAKADLRVFDERILAAKALIDECILSWSDGANSKLLALVDQAFRVNKQGYIDVNQVWSLRHLDIDDPQWQAAMDAIAEAIQVIGSSTYLRLYERQDDGQYRQISLDIARL